MASGTVLRPAGTRRAAGAAASTSLPAAWRDPEPCHPVTLLGGPCATQYQSAVTINCTVPMGVTKGTALFVSQEPSTVTATGWCVSIETVHPVFVTSHAKALFFNVYHVKTFFVRK